MYNDQSLLSGQLQRMGELRYEQGEITLLEKTMSVTMAAEMRNRAFQAGEEEKQALARLNWACYAEIPIVPSDTSLVVYPVSEGADLLSDLYSRYFSSKAEEEYTKIKIERSRFFPELSIGYVRQNILPLKNLNAWMVGAVFPIFFLPQKSRVNQAKITAYIARTEADANIRELSNRLTGLKATLLRCEQNLHYYTSSALSEADELIRTATLQLQHSETDVTQFIQAVNTAREIRRGYIEAVYQYNVAALEYELYK